MSSDLTLPIPNECWSKIFEYLPMATRIGRQQGYDIVPLDKVAVVCKRWYELCQATYVHLFHRQFSLTAPIDFQMKSPREWYLDIVDHVLVADLNHMIVRAAELGYEHIIDKCLHRPFDSGETFHHQITVLADSQDTPLSLTNLGLALYGGSPKIVKEILAYPETNPQLPVAIVKKYSEEYLVGALEFLLEWASEEVSGRLPEIIELLLNSDETVEITDRFVTIIKYLPERIEVLKRSADKIMAKQPYLFKHLLEKATDARNSDFKKYADAVEAGLKAVRSANFDRLGNLYFHLLCLGGDKDFKDLLPHIPDPNWVDKDGETLLIMAFQSGNLEMAFLLLEDKRIELKENFKNSLALLSRFFISPTELQRRTKIIFLAIAHRFFKRSPPETIREAVCYFRKHIRFHQYEATLTENVKVLAGSAWQDEELDH